MNLLDTKIIAIYFVLLYCCCLSTVLCYRMPWACFGSCVCSSSLPNGQSTDVHCKLQTVNEASRGLLKEISKEVVRSLTIECMKSDAVAEFNENLFLDYGDLLSLRVENCYTRSLSSDVFVGLNNLRSLYLLNLSFQQQPVILQPGVFDELQRLEWLHIFGCNIQRFPDKSFCQTKRLQVLNVSSNALATVQDVIRPQDCLSGELIIFDLSNNRISLLSDTDLESVKTIRGLFLDNNNVEQIANGTFAATEYLQRLTLQNNRITNVGHLPNSLLELNLAKNRLHSIPESVYALQNLEYLNLSSNEISNSARRQLNCHRLQTLDLSNNNFAKFPERLVELVSNNLTVFSIAFNHIKSVPKEFMLKALALEKMDLSHNMIDQIDGTIFNSSKLNYLNLSHNKISKISSDMLPETSSLLNLDLSHNKLQEVPLAVKKLIILQSLDLSFNEIKNIGKSTFIDLASLQHIDLSSNKLEKVHSGVFGDSRSLRELLLSNNSIKILASDAFDKCGRLEHLDLSKNLIASINRTLSTIDSLITANMSGNQLTVLEWKEFPSRLATLDVSNNRISQLGPADDCNIKIIKLNSNNLPKILATEIPDSVEVLDLSNNSIEAISSGTFFNKTNLRMVDLSSNKIHDIPKKVFFRKTPTPYDLYIANNPLQCSCEMSWLYENNKKIYLKIIDKNEAECTHIFEKYAISLGTIKDEQLLCTYKKFCRSECPCCDYSICYCNSLCPAGCHCYRNFNASTNIVHCKALNAENRRAFDIRKHIPNQATHIYFERMNFTNISRHSFLGLSLLQQLHINASGIKTIEKQAFKSLQSLKLLDLSDNELTQFTGDEFNEEMEITHLFLNNNYLQNLSAKILKKIPSLQYLTLHDNQFQELPEAVEKHGYALAKVSLAKNPFRCDCGNRFRIQDWLLDNINRVVDGINVECMENITAAFMQNDTTVLSNRPPNLGMDMFVINMLDFIKTANGSMCSPEADGIFSIEETTNYMLILIAILVPGFLVVALIILGRVVLQKTHAVMAQRRYKCPPSLNCSQITPGSSPVPLIHFDAFVSYAKKDEKLVIDALCRQLEYEEYLLCLLHRDGPVYNIKLHSVSDELINQMECSKALILVLTQNFLDGEWKTLQIKTSHRLFAKSRGKKLIALLGDGIEPNQLDAELGQILRKNTCIRMSDPLFWNLLHSALPERISPSNCSADSSQIYSDCYGTIVPSDIV